MAVLLQDNFDRADHNSIIGSPQIGPAPVVRSGTGGIIANQLYAPTGSTTQLIVTYDLGTPDVEVSFVNNGAGNNGGQIVLGWVSNTNYWLVGFTTAGVTLYQVHAANTTPHAFSDRAKPAANGSVCRAHYKDQVIRAYVDGVLVLRHYVEVPIASNLHGIRQYVTTTRQDNLLAEDAPVIDDDKVNGGMTSNSSLAATDTAPDSFVYKGRDTKVQDQAAGA